MFVDQSQTGVAMASANVLEEWSPLARVYCPLQAGSIDGTDTEPHDHGVVRAMNAVYTPNHHVQSEPNATLFVARLHPNTTEEVLEKVFSEYGRIEKVRLIRDIVTGFSKRYAFIEFETSDDARYAFRHAQSIDIDGAQVYVDFEIERTLKGWIPRRLGGGFGGKKESGQLRFGGRDRPFRKPIVVSREMTDSGSRGVLRLHEAGESGTRGREDVDFDSQRRYRRSRSRERSRRDYRDNDRQRDRGEGRYYERDRGRYYDRERSRYDDRGREDRNYRRRDRSRERRRSRSR